MTIFKNSVTLWMLALVLGVSVSMYLFSRSVAEENKLLRQEIAELRNGQEAVNTTFEDALLSLGANLTETKSEQEAIRSNLQSEIQKKASVLEAQLGQVSGTVSTLEKLTNTDEELLQKYSKVYFLNEHYIPAHLSRIEPAYVYQPKEPRDLQMHTSVWPYLERLLKDAENAGVDIVVTSAYRSFGAQEGLKQQYVIVYGAGTANQFSADQGYSEHQLGTTIDFTTSKTGVNWNAFEGTAAFSWLTKNAYKYGFTLSYPKTNTYYEYEPWHWRFVGKELAKFLYDSGKYFYDVDQREIDKYLISVFD